VNVDFDEMLSALSAAGADFLVVGAHALAVHGIVRATGDLDIWVRPTEQNAERVWAALTHFGAPLDKINKADLSQPGIVFQIGLPPRRIDLLTSISAVEFDEAWQRRLLVPWAGMQVWVIDRQTLIRNKTAAGRPRDLADVEELRDKEADDRT
jgi:hypothetical protein